MSPVAGPVAADAAAADPSVVVPVWGLSAPAGVLKTAGEDAVGSMATVQHHKEVVEAPADSPASVVQAVDDEATCADLAALSQWEQ